jgi:hypothetical protein
LPQRCPGGRDWRARGHLFERQGGPRHRLKPSRGSVVATAGPVDRSPVAHTLVCLPPLADCTSGVRQNRCTRSHLTKSRGARGERRARADSLQAVTARAAAVSAKTSVTDLVLAGEFEDRVGDVGGPHKHLEVPAAEVAVSPSLVPRATGRRRVVGTELEVATRRVRPARDGGELLGPELGRLRAYLRHDPRAQSLVGDLLQQVLVAQVGKLPHSASSASSSSANTGDASRSRSILLPPLPGANGRSPSTSTYAAIVPAMAVPMAGSNGQAPLWPTSTSGPPTSATWPATASACRRQYGAS